MSLRTIEKNLSERYYLTADMVEVFIVSYTYKLFSCVRRVKNVKVLTEIDLRTNLKKLGPIATYKVPSGTILTPAARSYLSENKIEIVFSDENAVQEKEKGYGPKQFFY